MIGVPVTAVALENSFLTIDASTWWRSGWLQVKAQDHLGRGGNANGIRQKLELYLESQVILIALRIQIQNSFSCSYNICGIEQI